MGILFDPFDLDWVTPAISLAKCATGAWTPISMFWNSQSPAYWQQVLEKAGIEAVFGGDHRDGFVLLVRPRHEFKARDVLQAFGAPLA